MPGQFGNKGGGRKGFGIENAKKHLLQQAYWIANKALEKECRDVTEKEKREFAFEIVKKALPKDIIVDAKIETDNKQETKNSKDIDELKNRFEKELKDSIKK